MSNQRGFSLLEVLISMLIIMFGLLGLAGMQMMALNNTETARYSSIASVLASDLNARIVGNINYWGTPPATVSIIKKNGSLSVSGGPASSTTDCGASTCTAPQMAYYDLTHWGTMVLNSLPAGSAALVCSSTDTPAVCTVTISWIEKNVGVFNPTGTEDNTAGLATGQSSTHNFQTLISIR